MEYRLNDKTVFRHSSLAGIAIVANLILVPVAASALYSVTNGNTIGAAAPPPSSPGSEFWRSYVSSPTERASASAMIWAHRGGRVEFGPSSRLVLTARLSGHQIMINGHALSPPLSVVATIPVDPEPRSGWSARSEARTNGLDGRRSLILPVGSHQGLPGDGQHGHGM
jgi:hypothetical protein